jgi:16S rRNA (guanine527-N7)-methyltransferase
MTTEELAQLCGLNGLELSSQQCKLLDRYAQLLKEKNQVVNLISRKDEDNILEKHILHSLTLLMPCISPFIIPQSAMVFDIGTGGGLPGIPIKIVRPDVTITLVDSIGKKITAVQEFIGALGLANARATKGRSEVLATKVEHKKQYDVIVSRAVAPLDELIGWTKDLVKPGATLLTLKGGDLSQEIKRTRNFRHIKDISESLLALKGYDGFVRDEKKVVRVSFL